MRNRIQPNFINNLGDDVSLFLAITPWGASCFVSILSALVTSKQLFL